jgi:hypothetical protein
VRAREQLFQLRRIAGIRLAAASPPMPPPAIRISGMEFGKNGPADYTQRQMCFRAALVALPLAAALPAVVQGPLLEELITGASGTRPPPSAATRRGR